MGKIIAFANQKGGVAKTTSTYNIGVALAQAGKATLMIDFDPQASLTICADKEPYLIEKTVVDVLQRKNALPIQACLQELRPNLYLAPACQELAQSEVDMFGRTASETILKRVLEPIRGHFDYILIDCPPQLSILTVNALSCADYVLIPCKTDYLAYRGMELLLDTVQDIRELVNPSLEIMGVFATMYDMRVKDDQEVLRKLQEEFEMIGIVKQLVSVKRGVGDGRAVTELAKDDEASNAYKQITAYIMERCGETA